jgi:uncharacterized protein involved in exopolysaccharide biosynthesis
MSSDQPTYNQRLQKLADTIAPYYYRLWEKKRKFLRINAAVLFLTIILLLLFAKPYYEVIVEILPDYGNQANLSGALGGLGGLASLAGIKLETSPTEIYQELISSETVLTPVVMAKYHSANFNDSVNLMTYYGIENDNTVPSSPEARKQFVALLKQLITKNISSEVDADTKVLFIKVRMPESRLAADVANTLAGSLDEYVRNTRKSYASNQRFYIEMRMSQVEDSLRISEDKMKEFNTQNRVIDQSPDLMLEQDRISRNVEILKGIDLQLHQQFEVAKIEEIKDAPVLNLMEPVKDPVVKAGPQRTLIAIFTMFWSVLLSALYFIFGADVKKELQAILDRFKNVPGK